MIEIDRAYSASDRLLKHRWALLKRRVREKGNMQGLLLGLANGTACLAYCAPVLIPYLLAGGNKTGTNYLLLSLFLAGRLAGYLIFGVLAWLAHALVLARIPGRELGVGLVYMTLATALAWFSWRASHPRCGGVGLMSGQLNRMDRDGWLFATLLGFLTGLNLCPPFLLAFAGAANSASVWGSLFFFFTFFLGTSLFFLPLPLVGKFPNNEKIRWVGKLAALVVAAYYFFVGFSLFGGGLFSL